MTSTVVPDLFTRIVDANGNPLAGAKMYWYLAGTTTPTTVYTDYATTTPAANPVIADSAGLFAPLYAKDGSYKIIFTDSADTALYTLDNYSVSTSGGGSTQVSMPVVAKTANYTVQSTDRNTVFLVDSSGVIGQNIIITADSATLGNGFPFTVINAGTAGTTTIVGTGAQTVNGSPSFTISSQNQGVNLDSNGVTGWIITGTTGGIFFNAATFYAAAIFNGSVTFLEQTLVVTSNIAAWNMANGPDAYVTNAAGLTMAAPTNAVSGMRGKLRINNSTGSAFSLTWNAAFDVLAGVLQTNLLPGTTYFEYWVSGTTIYISRTPMNGLLNNSKTNFTTSGINSDFSIPVGARRITIDFNSLSTNGTSRVIVQIGNGSAETTTYSSETTTIGGAASGDITSGFVVAGTTSGIFRDGQMVLDHLGSNQWVERSQTKIRSTTGTISVGVGYKTTSGVVTILRITTISSDTFNGGSATVSVEF